MKNQRRMVWTAAVVVVAVGASVLLMRGSLPHGARAGHQRTDPSYEQYRTRTSVEVNGFFRDFNPAGTPGGHPDFGRLPGAGAGRYANIVGDYLSADGAPAFRSSGYKVFQDWRDASNRAIMAPRSYISAKPGDVAGSISTVAGEAVTTAANFASWFRDTPGFATGERGVLTFNRNPSTGEYTYNGYLEGPSPSGSISSNDGDASTTYVVDTMFIYERGKGQFIEVATDGDAWVFVGERLVLGSGGGGSYPWSYRGLCVDGSIIMENNCSVEVSPGAIVSTNATGAGAVNLSNSASITGSVLVGPGADPATAIVGRNRISGSVGTLTSPVPIPTVTAPTALGASLGTVHYNGVNSTINTSFRCDNLIFDGNNQITVRGHVTILCATATIRNRTTIDIAPNSSLEIYCTGAFTVDNYVNLNVNTGDPSLVTIYVLGTTPISLPNNATLVANFVSPNVGMTIGNSVTVIGGFYGSSVLIRNGGRFVATPTADSAGGGGDRHASMIQRIDLDRLTWLDNRRTYPLKMFFADRNPPKSAFNIRTNIDTLNLAVPPPLLLETD